MGLKAVVLAAGEGKRLRPLTATRPKHMIPIGGRPLLEHHLLALRESGIEDVLLIVNYKADQIKGYFGDGSRLGMKISYAHQREIRGTANAFSLAEDYVDGDFLATYGDLLINAKAVRSALSLHLKEQPTVTITTVEVENPEQYAVVKLEQRRVVKIIEKPQPGSIISRQANAGVYVFSQEIFDAIRQTGYSSRGEQEITDSIRILIERGEEVLAAKISFNDWLDVGRPWDILEANMRILRRIRHEVLGDVEEGAYVFGPIFVDENARIRSGAYIEGPAYIGSGSDIGPNCYVRPYTSIGRNVRVGNACEIKNSILMDHVHIGHLSYVGDSIIGEDCNLGAGTITANLRFDNRPVKMKIKEEVISTGRRKMGVVMGDSVKTGIGSLFMPGVKIGCNSWIGPNTVVYRDIPSNTIVMLEQQIQRKYR
ncbi:glucose-1-phosphate thymidylyltransferase [Candidatus Bathyarchaeota archaeon]|nr:MAG: glucose-1-phosphate thymidylyltransferase [Candidatus Bathyarchaeota archaeon]